MKKEIANLWADALDSGEFKQTKGHLRDEEGYCCLGVLCSLYEKQTGDMVIGAGLHLGDSLLPDPVREWAGITSIKAHSFDFGSYSAKDEIPEDASLARKNDGGFSFAQISQIIRKEWEEY